MQLLKVISISCAVLAYGSFIWAARSYFANKEQSNKKEYNFINLAGSFFIVLLFVAQVIGSPSKVQQVVGSVLLVLSFTLLIWAISIQNNGKLDFAFTGNVPRFLTTKGPYRIVRHPIYLAYLLGWLGGAIASGYYILCIVAFVMGRSYIKAIEQEERLFAESKFKEAYQKYTQGTSRIIPFIY